MVDSGVKVSTFATILAYYHRLKVAHFSAIIGRVEKSCKSYNVFAL